MEHKRNKEEVANRNAKFEAMAPDEKEQFLQKERQQEAASRVNSPKAKQKRYQQEANTEVNFGMIKFDNSIHTFAGCENCPEKQPLTVT